MRFGVNIPLWSSGKKAQSVRSSEQLSLAPREKERSVRDMLEMRFGDAQAALTLARESIQQYDTALLPEAEAALSASELAYEVGQTDFDALLAAQRDLLEIRLERLDLLRQYHQTKAVLAELIGTPKEEVSK